MKIQLSGGFHNSQSISIRPTIIADCAYVSPSQARRLQKHFCGIKSCACGGTTRADITMPNGWMLTDKRFGAHGICATLIRIGNE